MYSRTLTDVSSYKLLGCIGAANVFSESRLIKVPCACAKRSQSNANMVKQGNIARFSPGV